MRNGNYGKFIIAAAAVFVLAALLYFYGADIPGVNKLPLFRGHEHTYRPVFDDSGDIEYWTCTMHPSVRLKDPGTCPICGMDTVPVRKNANNLTGRSETTEEKEDTGIMSGHDHSSMIARNVDEGAAQSTFLVSPEKQQIIGVKTEEVKVRDLNRQIRTVGMVTLDESKIYNVQTRFSGWVEKVFVDYTWAHVHKGEPLFTVYSPELVTAQQEYLLAYKSSGILRNNRYREISEGADSLLGASRRRLELLGVTSGQIAELERTGEVQTALTVFSPAMGHVAKKEVFENMRVEPDMVLYKIADHTTAWVEVEIYENEISLINVGTEARMTVPSLPGKTFEGSVTFIWPHIMPETRTVKARLEFPNPDLDLLPEMFADVVLRIPAGENLAVPSGAVLRTGKQDIVFVDLGGGRFQIRKVSLGVKAGDYYEVLRGLSEGERVVSAASFLIDSESKVQAAVATWGEGDTEDAPPAGDTGATEENR